MSSTLGSFLALRVAGLYGLGKGRPQDALLGDDACYQFVGRHIEGRGADSHAVGRGAAPSPAGDFLRAALFDGNVLARCRVGVYG